ELGQRPSSKSFLLLLWEFVRLCDNFLEEFPHRLLILLRDFGVGPALPLSRVRPYRTRLRDATRRAVRAAEPAGQGRPHVGSFGEFYESYCQGQIFSYAPMSPHSQSAH